MQIVIIFILVVGLISQCFSTDTDTSQPVEQSSPYSPVFDNDAVTYRGTTSSGHSLYAEDGANCVYVVGVTEADLARLGTDVWGFKDAVKAETGYRCVLFE